MKPGLLLLGLCLLLAACAGATPQPAASAPGLLPLPSATPSPAVTPQLATSTPLPTLTPTATPTPVTYVVKKGDTLGGIAYSYGISVDALQAANPKAQPAFLSIGQVLTIPVTVESVAPGSVGVASPTPLPLTLPGGPACYPMVTGALYCFVEARNPVAASLQNVAVQIALIGPKGETLASQPAYSALEVIPPGGAAPLAALFAAAPPGMVAPVAQVLSAEAADGATRYFALEIPASNGTPQPGASLRVTGQVRNPSATAAAQAKLVLTLYDKEGKILGYRQEALAGGLAAGATQDFSISAASLGGEIDHYVIVAEGKP